MITPPGCVASRLVIFRQFVDDGLGCASYLIGDEDTGEAAVVDPAYWIEQYVEEASRQEVRLVSVLETHTHADHLSGHGRLALDHGCPVHIHRAAEADYAHAPLDDGTVVDVGAISIRTIHTPGHRPEHCAFAVSDRHRSDALTRELPAPDVQERTSGAGARGGSDLRSVIMPGWWGVAS